MKNSLLFKNPKNYICGCIYKYKHCMPFLSFILIFNGFTSNSYGCFDCCCEEREDPPKQTNMKLKRTAFNSTNTQSLYQTGKTVIYTQQPTAYNTQPIASNYGRSALFQPREIPYQSGWDRLMSSSRGSSSTGLNWNERRGYE